jgi:hypothetical protein
MRTVLALAVMALAGCDFQAPARPPGGGGDDGAAEPDASPAPIDGDDSNGDRDGDGVANAADNCADVANADQYNEDTDARGDACDPCPQLAAAADDTDGDGDGVGDGCDPNPGTGGDKLVLWNGFQIDSTTLPAELSMIHGSAARWSVANGSLVFTHTTSDDWNIPAFDTGARNHTVDAELEITGTFPGSATAAGVAVDIAGNDDDVSECQIRTDNGRRELWYWNGRGIGGNWTELNGAAAATPNDTYRIVLKRTPGDLACSTFLGGANTALASTRDSANRTRAGLFMRNVDVRVHYLAIYTSP